MESRRVVWTIVVVLVLAMTLVGCAPVPDENTGETDASEPGEAAAADQPELESASPAEAGDFGYLAGNWDVAATLTDIDRTAMQERAEMPQQHWQCTLEGSTMTLVTDTHTYVGTIEPDIGDEWTFTGNAELADEDGVAWTNRLTIHGIHAGDDSIAGTMELAVDSTSLGHAYTASWDFEGHRQ